MTLPMPDGDPVTLADLAAIDRMRVGQAVTAEQVGIFTRDVAS